MKALMLIVSLLIASPAGAQSSVVASVKADLQARGVDITGECGAFQIVKRVAWQLRAQGAGLVAKQGGSQCQGYSTDLIQFAPPAGHWVDILQDAGGQNVPQWTDNGVGDGSVWRPPVDPGDSTPSPMPPSPGTPVPPTVTDLTPLHQHLERVYLDLKAEALAATARDVAQDALLKRHDEEPMFITKFFGNRYVQIGLGIVTTWLTTHEIKKD